MRVVIFVSLFLVNLFCAGVSSASSEALRNFLSDVNTLSAEFSQFVADEQGSILETSGGKFSLSRPGKFRWDYKNEFFESEMTNDLQEVRSRRALLNFAI